MTPSSKRLSYELVRSMLEGYFSPLPLGIETKIQKYIDLMTTWGKKMSLTSVRDPAEIVKLHFGESIFAMTVGKLPDGRLADVGTGAGFPGLAIKLVVSELPITLIEPNKKKCAFLHEVIRCLGLKNIIVVPTAYESSQILGNSISVLTSRALEVTNHLLQWASKVLNADGEALFWSGREDSERISAIKGWQWGEPVLIPGTKSRFILKGRPLR